MYAGEPVTQTEHALQCALLAERDKSDSPLIAAALLHDLGHLLHGFGENCANDGINDQHEDLGAKWLSRWFGPEVCDPIHLHVTAKRYRCTVDPVYVESLSDASQQSFKLQGGRLSEKQTEQFRSHPFFQQALRLRDWDDAAKVPALETPSLDHFLKYVEASLA